MKAPVQQVKVLKQTYTTDSNGMFVPNLPANAIIVGVSFESGWRHARLYSGSGWAARFYVTNYDTDTRVTNTSVTARIAYVVATD